MSLQDKEILMLKDKDDGSNLEESILVYPKKEVKKAMDKLVKRFTKIAEIENLDLKWILCPIREEFGDDLVPISEVSRNG